MTNSTSNTALTTIKVSTNISLTLPLSDRRQGQVVEATIKELEKAHNHSKGADQAEVVDNVLWDLGINTFHNSAHLLRNDEDGGSFPTFLGSLLLRKTNCYDWQDYGVKRAPKIEPAGDESTWQYGDAAYAYVSIFPTRKDVPQELVVYLEGLIEAAFMAHNGPVLKKVLAERRSWGQEQNLKLETAGCSKIETQAWWSMHWKKEWHEKDWRQFCSHSDEEISHAMAAHSTAYLVAVGIRSMGRSFPRTMDAVEALGKARGLKPKRLPDWKRWANMPRPDDIEEGCGVWRF